MKELEKLAGCLIINEEGMILLVKEAKDWYWKIPSGKIDGDESLEECARRETKEETGIEVEIEEFFNAYDFEFKNRNFRLNVYKAKIIDGTPKSQEGDNISEVKWFPISFLKQENSTPSDKLIYQDLIRRAKWKV